MTVLEQAAARFPRIPLSHLPTPFEAMADLAAATGGPRLFVKRDDQTGLAFGGNKARKLEFILADMKARRFGSVITWAGTQSNWVRMCTAAAVRFGIKPILVLKLRPDQTREAADGNLLLDRILGAEVHLLGPDEDQPAAVERVAEAERARGRKPYLIAAGGSGTEWSMTEPLGAVAYALAFEELWGQAQEQGAPLTHLVLASGSGSTHAGIVVGAKAAAPEVEIIGVSTRASQAEGEANVLGLARKTVAAMDLDLEIEPGDVTVLDGYVGGGYGILYPAVVEAIATLARTEAIFLDPVYTGKAMTGFLDLIRKKRFAPDDAVCFLHTGGTPALFPYREEILEVIEGDATA